MIKIIGGSLLDATEDILCHQVNCQGVMGSGIALALRNNYPNLYESYYNFCLYCNKVHALGGAQFVEQEDGHIVANLFGQYDYGRKNILYTNYTELEVAFVRLRNYAVENNLSIAMPYGISCGLANGDWQIVYKMIERVFYNIDVTLYKI